MEIFNIEQINKEIKENVKGLIEKAENSFKKQIDDLVEQIDTNDIDEKVILISGPSCAGKTTFAKILKAELVEKGYEIVNVEMDNFFITRSLRPRLPDGSEDLESIGAVNLNLLEKCFKELFKNKKALFPRYDFELRKSIPNSIDIEIGPKTVIIFEGIHALNPKLFKKLGTNSIFKVFICNQQRYNSKAGDLQARQIRMIRRMVRDYDRRATSPRETMESWESVVDGENKNIFPFENEADFIVNSSHSYELGLYQELLNKFTTEDKRLLTDLPFLSEAMEIEPISKTLCPENTLMWEFVKKPEK